MSPSELRLSASLYTTWKQCPAQAAGRLDGHYQPDSIHTFKGLLAHRIFARHLTDGHIAPSGFRKLCLQEIGSSNLNWKQRDLNLKPSQIHSVISEVADLYRRFTTLKPHGQAEVHLEHELTDQITLLGTIDCVTGSPDMPELTDWKTGELGNAADQLRFYALLYWLAQGHMPLSVRAVSVTTGEQHVEWVQRPLLNTTLFDVIDCAVDLSTPGAPLTVPGPWCRWCPLLESCRPGQQTVALVG